MNRVQISKFPPLSYAGTEAINTLCTNLTFSGDNVKRIMITSCHASEGKSMISMNILRTMAKLGKKAVLVDADLRRSMIAQDYGLRFERPESMGLTHLLAGMAREEDVLYTTDIPGASIVPVIKTVSSSLSLLNSDKLQKLLDLLAEYFDYVIVDAPPIGALIDAAQIARYCDGTLLVVNYNAVRKQELVDAQHQLQATGCPILGTVINQAQFDTYMSRKYYYKSYYSHYDSSYNISSKRKGKKSKLLHIGKSEADKK
ncbi:MAG: CpsD/CapB family tyrosine-protein kinase [Clostridia bacterium]|nr:CpsD/CapB family tyrosine-protein kinase [Clostridia bacterium]